MKLKTLAMAGAALAMLSGATATAGVVDKPTFKVGGLVVVWGAPDANVTGTTTQNVVTDFYLLDGTTATDIMDGDIDGTAAGDAGGTIVTGALASIDGDDVTGDATNGYLQANAALSAFDVDGSTDVNGSSANSFQGRFYVASNTAFGVQATRVAAKNVNTFGVDANGDKLVDFDDVSYSLTLDTTGTAEAGLAFGGAAQNPHSAGTGVDTAVVKLSDIGTDTKVFTGDRRTAAAVGGLAAQSVRFNTSYTLDTASGNAVDLSVGTGELSAEVVYTIFNP